MTVHRPQIGVGTGSPFGQGELSFSGPPPSTELLTLLVTGTAGNRVIKSTDGGLTWATPPAPPWLSCKLSAANNLFVAVGNNGTDYAIWTSADGNSWTLRQTLPEQGGRAVWTGSEFWVPIFDMTTNHLYKSADGITWTQVITSGTRPQNLPILHWTSGGFFFAASNYTNLGLSIYKSTNGLVWTRTLFDTDLTSPVPAGMLECALPNTMVMLNLSPFLLQLSHSGAAYGIPTIPISTDGYRFGGGNDGGENALVLPRGQYLNYSLDDGTTWNQVNSPTGDWFDVIWTGTRFVACSSFDTIIATSPEGINWTSRSASNIGGTHIAGLP